jgi:hypothetical protein
MFYGRQNGLLLKMSNQDDGLMVKRLRQRYRQFSREPIRTQAQSVIKVSVATLFCKTMRASRDIRGGSRGTRRKSRVAPVNDDSHQGGNEAERAAAATTDVPGCFMTLQELTEWQETLKTLKSKLVSLEEKDNLSQSKINDYVDLCGKKDKKIKDLEFQLVKWYNSEQREVHESDDLIKLKNENGLKQAQIVELTSDLRDAQAQIMSMELLLNDTRQKYEHLLSSTATTTRTTVANNMDNRVDNDDQSIVSVASLLPTPAVDLSVPDAMDGVIDPLIVHDLVHDEEVADEDNGTFTNKIVNTEMAKVGPHSLLMTPQVSEVSCRIWFFDLSIYHFPLYHFRDIHKLIFTLLFPFFLYIHIYIYEGCRGCI